MRVVLLLEGLTMVLLLSGLQTRLLGNVHTCMQCNLLITDTRRIILPTVGRLSSLQR